MNCKFILCPYISFLIIKFFVCFFKLDLLYCCKIVDIQLLINNPVSFIYPQLLLYFIFLLT